MSQNQQEDDKYTLWKNSINASFNKGSIPLDELLSATNSLFKYKHLQSPYENGTEDFLNTCLPYIVSVVLNCTVKTEKIGNIVKSFLANVVKLVILFIDYNEYNKENSSFPIHKIWTFYNSIQIIFTQRNSNFYQCYQKITSEHPIDGFKSKIDSSFFTRIHNFFTNLIVQNQDYARAKANGNNDDPTNNIHDIHADDGLQRIHSSLSLIISFDFSYRFTNEVIVARNQAIQTILKYFFCLFAPVQPESKESKSNNESNSFLINLRTLDDKLFESILKLFKSVCVKGLKEEFIHDELYICTLIANCQFLNKQFFAFKLIKEILSSSLTDVKECQILSDLQFIDQILKRNDLHEELVKYFSEIFIRMMRNKLIKKTEHIKLYWNLVVIKQHSSTIGPFLSGLESIIVATTTGIVNQEKDSKKNSGNQRIFDEEMTDALIETIIEKNVFPIEVIQFLGKGILILNPKQKRLLFDTLNSIYFKMISNENGDKIAEAKSNENINTDNESQNLKTIEKKSSSLYSEQNDYINKLLKALSILIPDESDDIEEKCLQFIQNHESVHYNYAISLLQASVTNNKINSEKADTYINLMLDSMATTDLFDISQYFQLLIIIILRLSKLHKKQFKKITDITKSILETNSKQFCDFYHNLIEKTSKKQLVTSKMIESLFQDTCTLCEEKSLFNEDIMNFLLYIYQKLDSKASLDSENQNIKFIWNLLFKTGSEFVSSFLLSIYKESKSEAAINDFIGQCIQHIDNIGAIKSILNMIDSFGKDEKVLSSKETDIFKTPNLYICEEDDFCSINFSGAINVKVKMHFDSSYDDVCRKAAIYLSTESDDVALYNQTTGKIINRGNFEIQNGMIYRVKKLNLQKNVTKNKKVEPQVTFVKEKNKDVEEKKKEIINLPSKIIIENKEYSQALFNALQSDNDLQALTAYRILNKIPPLQESICPILCLNTRKQGNDSLEDNNENNEDNKESQESIENDKNIENTKNNEENDKSSEESKETDENDNDNNNNKEKDDDENKKVDEKNKDDENKKEDEIYDYKNLKPDWSQSLNKAHKYLFLYQSNTIGNVLKYQFDSEWIEFYFETGGALEYMKAALSTETKENFKLNERYLLTIWHVASLICHQHQWKDMINGVSSCFNKEEFISQIMNLSNDTQISLSIFLLQSILINSDISNFFNNDENKFKLLIKTMIFDENVKIRKSIKNLISSVMDSSKSIDGLYEKQETFFTDLLDDAIKNEKSCNSFFSLMQKFSTEPKYPLKIWKATIKLLFEKFTIPDSENYIEKLTYKMPTTDLAISLIIILANIAFYHSNKINDKKEELPDQEQLLTFILNNVLFNGIKYFKLCKQIFDLISFILKNNPPLNKTVMQKIKDNQEQMRQLLNPNSNSDDFSNYKKEDSCSFTRLNFLSTNNKYRGIRNLGATCYINSTIQQLYSINEMKKIVLDEKYSTDEWTGNLQLAFAQLLLYPSSYVDISPFVQHWNGWDGKPINPREQQDAVEFLQMLFGRMEEKMPSFKSLFEGTFQYHFKSCDSNIAYENDTFDNFTMLSLEVKGMNCIEDSFRMFVEPEVFNDYKVDDFNGFSGKIDVEKYSMIKKAPEILIIQLKRFEYNLSTCQREKLNSKYMFDYEIDLAPIMIDKEEPVIYELFGIQMHSGFATGGHYFSYIKYPNSSDDEDGSDYCWMKFNDVSVTVVDQSTLIDRCCGGNRVIESSDDGNSNGGNIATKVFENSSNAYLLYYRRKNSDNSKINNNIKSVIDNIDQDLVTNLSNDIKKLIFSNIFSSELFSDFIVNHIANVDEKGEILYDLIISSFKKASEISKNRFYSNDNQNKETDNLVKVAINIMNSQFESKNRSKDKSTEASDLEGSSFADYILSRNDDIIYYLLIEDSPQVRKLFLKLLEKAIETSNLSARVVLVALYESKITDVTFCNTYLHKSWEHFDTFFQTFLVFESCGYITGEWANIFASFLFESFIPYCESNGKESIYANIDLSSFFTIFMECQKIQNQKLLLSKSSKVVKTVKSKSSSVTATMSVIKSARNIDKAFVENFLLSTKHLHSFIMFLLEYPSFDISNTINLRTFDVDQYSIMMLARYFVLSIWFIEKLTEKLSNFISNSKDKNKIKDKDMEKTRKLYQSELINKRNDAIKLNKMICDNITNSRRSEKRVTGFLSTLTTLITFSPDSSISMKSTLEFHTSFVHTLKQSSFYSAINSLIGTYSTSPILTKFIASEIPIYRSLVYQFIKKLIKNVENSNGFILNDNKKSTPQSYIGPKECEELFRTIFSKNDVIVALITKDIKKYNKEEFPSINPSTDYYEILTKLVKIGNFKHKLVFYEVSKSLISTMKCFGQLNRKQPLIDCFNFIFESVGVEYVEMFFTPISNFSNANEQTIEAARVTSYRDFLHSFDKFKGHNEYNNKNATTTNSTTATANNNNGFNYGYSKYVSKDTDREESYLDDDDGSEYEENSYSDDFATFNSDNGTNCNSLRGITTRVISFIPSYGYDMFFDSKFFKAVAGTQYIENKMYPTSGSAFTNFIMLHLNHNNVSNIVKALFKPKIIEYYLKNFSKPFFVLINKILQHFPRFSSPFFVESKLFSSILNRIQQLASRHNKSDSSVVSLLSKTMSIIIFSALSSKSLIFYNMKYNKKKSKTEDDSVLSEKYNQMRINQNHLQNQTLLSLKDVYKAALIENGNGLSYLLAAMAFLSEKSIKKVFRYFSQNNKSFINSVPKNARKGAAFAVSRVCYRMFYCSLFRFLSIYCANLSNVQFISSKSKSYSPNSSNSALLFNSIKENVDKIKMSKLIKEDVPFQQSSTFEIFDDDFYSNANNKKNLSVINPLIKIIDEINATLDSNIFDVENIGNNLVDSLYMMLSLLNLVAESMISVFEKNIKPLKTSPEPNSTQQKNASFYIKQTNKFISLIFTYEESQNQTKKLSLNDLIIPAIDKIYSKSAEINNDQIFVGFFFKVVDLTLTGNEGKLTNSNQSFCPFDFKVSKDSAKKWIEAAAKLLSCKIKGALDNLSRESIIHSSNSTINIFEFMEDVICRFNSKNKEQIEWPPLNLTEKEITNLACIFQNNQNQSCQKASEHLTRLISISNLIDEPVLEEEEQE